MASATLKTTSKGQRFYDIRYHAKDAKTFATRWYVPAGWSDKAIQRELAKVSAEFERQCKAGEVQTRKDRIEAGEAAKREEAKILTLRQYCEKVFMPQITITATENTRSNFQRCLDLRILPALGDFKMPKITPAQIKALLLSIQSEGKSHATVIKYYTILNLIFKDAFMADMIPQNPMYKVERPKASKTTAKSEKTEAFTEAELAYIEDCLAHEPLKWQAMIRLMIDTGIRRGEACGLKWQYVDFEQNCITVAGNLQYTKDKGIYLDTPKNGKCRTIFVDPAVMGLLRQLRLEQSRRAISQFVFTQDDSPLPMHPQSPARYLQKFGKKNAIDHLHPHKLRHSYASVALTNGADLVSVSENLGHSDSAVTLRMYAHANEESRKRASATMREAIQRARANG